MDDGQRVDTRLALRAEHLDDHPLAIANVRREADHVDHHLVVRLDALRARVADVDRRVEYLAVDFDQAHVGPLEVGAHEPAGRALDHIDHATFRFTLVAQLLVDLDPDLVARVRVERGLLGNMDVRVAAGARLRAFRADESLAGRHAAEGAQDLIGGVALCFLFFRRQVLAGGVIFFGRQHQVVGAVLELTRLYHLLDRPPYGEHAVLVDQAQTLGNHGRLDGLVGWLPGVSQNRSAKVGVH